MTKFKVLVASCLFAWFSAFGGYAEAQSTINVYTWNGLCADCWPLGDVPATATLKLKDYTAGTALTAANFLSFSYTSAAFPDGISLVPDGSTVVSLSGTLPAHGDAAISLSGLTNAGSGSGRYSFATFGNGAWVLALNGTSMDEHGESLNSSYFRFDHDEKCTSRCGNQVTSLTSEPNTYAMMLAGLGLMGFVARRRQA
jgi:hypothetical protein